MRHAVIIPSYNHARYIGRALESALSQTRKPDRVIVIDDGSKDDSLEVLRSFASRGVEWSARENRGAHATLNELVEKASADCQVISILNSDDHWHPARFEKCLPLLERHPDKQAVVSAVRVMDENDADIDPAVPTAKWFRAVWSLHTPGRDPAEWLGVANFPATTSNVTARADWLRRFPFRPYRFNHDYWFLAQTVLRDALLVHPEPLVNYRVHGSNTMNTAPAPLLREMLRMNLDLARDLAPELASDPALRARFERYSRAQWDSISSFHPGLYQVLLAGAASRLTDEQAKAAADSLTEDRFPELLTPPNSALLDTWDETTPVAGMIGLAEKYEALRLEARDLKTRNRQIKGLKVTTRQSRDLATLRARLADSRWLAAGRLLGLWKAPRPLKPNVSQSPGTPVPAENAEGEETGNPAEILEQALTQQPWVRLGRKLGLFRIR